MGASTVVKVGETLAIPSAAAWEGASAFWIVHEVGAGETLSEIAKAYGVTVTELQAANGMGGGDVIRVGQALVLPVRGPVEVRPLAPAPTATAIRLPTPTATPMAPDAGSAAAAPSEPTVAPVPPPSNGPPPDVADWPRELVRLINELRAERGLPPYVYNETLAHAAQLHAEDCMRRGSCSHTGSDGSTVQQRIMRAGYVGTGYAECWAQRKTPQGALDIWMDEVYPQADGSVLYGPHLKMMIHTWFTEIGVGVAESQWGYYFIANFGRP